MPRRLSAADPRELAPVEPHPRKEKVLVTAPQFGYEWLVVSVQLVGLLGMILTRVVGTAKAQHVFHWLFLAWMGIAGLVTLSCVHLGCQVWIPLGTTLAVMVLGATLDLSRVPSRRPF